MVILGVDAGIFKITLSSVLDLFAINNRPAGDITIEGYLENIVLVAAAYIKKAEVPEVIVRFIKEIQAVQAFDPADTD